MGVRHIWTVPRLGDYPAAMGLSRAFSGVVRRMMHRMRLSIRRLSHRSGVPESTLRRVVGGQQQVSLGQAKAVADGLDTSATDLVSQAEDKLDNEQS